MNQNSVIVSNSNVYLSYYTLIVFFISKLQDLRHNSETVMKKRERDTTAWSAAKLLPELEKITL